MKRVLGRASVAFVLLTLVSSAWAQAAVPSAASAKLPDAPGAQVQSNNSPSFAVARSNAVTGIPTTLPESATFPLTGTHATLNLVSDVSSKLPSGSAFQAKLKTPITMNGQLLLPEGTMFEGHFRAVHARHLMRPGSVFLVFERAILPSGLVQPLDAHLVSADSKAVKTDTEGMLHPATSKKRLVIELGGASLAAKFGDDLAQVAGGTTLTASKARFAGAGAAAAFLVFQKGREVKLRAGDSLHIEFGRDAVVQVQSAPAVSR